MEGRHDQDLKRGHAHSTRSGSPGSPDMYSINNDINCPSFLSHWNSVSIKAILFSLVPLTKLVSANVLPRAKHRQLLRAPKPSPAPLGLTVRATRKMPCGILCQSVKYGAKQQQSHQIGALQKVEIIHPREFICSFSYGRSVRWHVSFARSPWCVSKRERKKLYSQPTRPSPLNHRNE